MKFEEFESELHACGLQYTGGKSDKNLIDVYFRFRIGLENAERIQCQDQIKSFAFKYVEKHGSTDGAKAQGWAILQAADDLIAKSL